MAKTSTSAIGPGASDGATPASREKKDMASLRADIEHLKRTVNQAVIAAGAAILVAVSGPLWAPAVTAAFGGSDPGSARVLVLAVEQLRPAISSSAPFEAQIKLVRRMMGDDREVMRILEQIETAAPQGVPSLDALRAHFVRVANQIFVAELFRIESDERWLNRAVMSVASAIRPHDLSRGLDLNGLGPSAALLTEAAHRLGQDDLPGAIRVVEQLHGSHAAMASAWLANARLRDDASRGLSMLEALAAARLPGAYRL
jgi:hypothetical protein